MMGGVVEIYSAVCLDSIVCTVWRDKCEEGLDLCRLGRGR